MPTEQDASKTAGLSPQTPAARRRSAEERERLREESRARRRARADANGNANGNGFAIEPDATKIKIRRLTGDEQSQSTKPPTAPTKPAAEEPRPAEEQAGPAQPQTQEPQAAQPEAAKREAPQAAAPSLDAPLPEAPEQAEAQQAEAPPAEAPQAEAPQAEAPQAAAPSLDAPLPEAPEQAEAQQPEAPQAEAQQAEAQQAEAQQAQAPQAQGPPVQAPPRRHAPSTPAAGRFAPAPTPASPAPPTPPPTAPGAPPARPAPGRPLPRPRVQLHLPTARRERVAALLGLASAVGVVISLGATLGSGGLPGISATGMRAEPSARAVAPGGWIRLTGEDAPSNADLVLESRSKGGQWRAAGQGTSDGDGDFSLRGRVLEQPGRVMLRARVPGVAAATPVAVTVRPLRLASVGDINLGDVAGEGIAASGPRYPWETAGKALSGADLSFGNLECAVSTGGAPVSRQYNFRATPAALAGLRRHSGIDVLNLANNHVGDYGPEATVDTVRGVERLGMKAVGAGADLERALAPQVVERLGLKVAFVGFSEIGPIEFAAGEGRPGTAWADPDKIAAAVQAARKRADVVVATFHWGIERQTLETARQRELADVAVRAGAQVVIGTHPHTLQPVRRQGGAIVAYSLGNFVFGAQSPETSYTGILELDLTAEGVTQARWRSARIEGGRPQLDEKAPRRLPLRDAVKMAAGVNL